MVEFEVDVYLPFVDGNDKTYVSKMLACADRLQDYGQGTSGLCRINNFEQLRLAVRSIAYCLPWIRTLHLVFHDESHIPGWLNRDHPKIRTHCHRDYFDSRIKLPTFSSFTIDTQIGRVPGLANHFIYIEDDQFFCRKINKSELFSDNGMPKFGHFVSPEGMKGWQNMESFDRNARLIWPNTYKFCNQIWKNKFGVSGDVEVTMADDHRPFPFLKSIFEITNTTFSELYDRSLRQRFRRSNVLSLHAYLWGMVWNQMMINRLVWRLSRFNLPGGAPENHVYQNFHSCCLNDETNFKDSDEQFSGTQETVLIIEALMLSLFKEKSCFEVEA